MAVAAPSPDPTETLEVLAALVQAQNEALAALASAVAHWDAVRRGMTPAAEAAGRAAVAHKAALHKAGLARQRVYEAQEAYRQALEELRVCRREAAAAAASRRAELAQARRAIAASRHSHAQALEMCRRAIRQCCGADADDRLVLAVARRIGVSVRYIMAVLGKRTRGRMDESEREALVAHLGTGLPWKILASHYLVSMSCIARLAAHSPRDRAAE